jgi:hypothetical protein
MSANSAGRWVCLHSHCDCAQLGGSAGLFLRVADDVAAIAIMHMETMEALLVVVARD